MEPVTQVEPITQVYDYLDRQNREEAATFRVRSPRFNPSGIHNCSRAIYYKQMGEAPRVKPGFINLYGMDGDIAHDSVRWLMKKAGVELGDLEFKNDGRVEETAFFKRTLQHNGQTFVVSGRSDGKVKIDGEWMALEIKSISGFAAKWIQTAYKKGELEEYLRKKYLKWYMQTTLTSKFLGFDKTYFVLKDRSLCQLGLRDEVNDIREGMIFHTDEELYEKMLNKMAAITKAVGAKEPPIFGYTEGSYECGICDFNHICRAKE